MRLLRSGHSSGWRAWFVLDLIIATAVAAVIARELVRGTTARSIASFAVDMGRRQLHMLPESSGYLAGLAIGLLVFGALVAAGIGILALVSRFRPNARDITHRS